MKSVLIDTGRYTWKVETLLKFMNSKNLKKQLKCSFHAPQIQLWKTIAE